jgi:hypothetical protein
VNGPHAFAHGQTEAPIATLPGVSIEGNYDNAVGSSDASSQGLVTSKLIESRPTLRPAEVLEFVPGVIVTQHSGGGKANQYFLRGFNLDHGTDFATFVDGMPVNMPTHAHGHGYSDLNWLIPELIDRIRYKKGPYFADEGDLSSAGAARIDLLNFTPLGIASLTVGQRGYRRGLVTDTNNFGDGKLLYAIEAAHNDGPWDSPEKFHRLSGVLRYSFGNAADRSSITAMVYDAGWMASDQIPLDAVASGQLGRFATVDPSDGGVTSRYSLSFNTTKKFDDGSFQFSAYAIQSKLDLFSNFTYFLGDPVHGDQFEQAEHRRVIGMSTRRSWDHSLAGQDSTTTLGLQVRQDRLSPVGLYATEQRQRLSVTQESHVLETNAGLHAENATQWLPWLRSVAGLRIDHFDFDVTSSIAANSGKRSADIASPKLSFILGPWAKTEYFMNCNYSAPTASSG